MQRELWRRASAVFEQALEVEADRRSEWLAAQCVGDEALLVLVQRLLAADEGSGEFLERPFAGGTDTTAAADLGEGTSFGAYRAVERIGMGGMGEVWRAQRADGAFEQHVAIKRLLYPTPDLVRRFQHERRVLARLHHPNIAQLFDGGLGADGVPYFVMEYVDGEPLDAWCDARGLGIDARIDLFLQVCDAVQYAHRNLVVHRDLKPSNILVTAEGQVKLLDFGIAKLIEATADGEATATIVQRLTPDYAAPEQVRGEAVTTATDVYALGMVLCELLAGERAYRVAGGDLANAIVAAEPAAPSAIAARGAAAARDRAPTLRGDLDRIVLRALAKEPERRYAGAESLAADLRRFRSGHPVLARGDDVWYRARKFAGRNRVAIGAAAVVAAALVAATAVSLHHARRAQRQAQRAEAEKAFVLGILDANDPNDTQGKGETLTARQILDRASERIGKDLADQPAVAAELYDEIGNLYWDYGQYVRALPLYEQSARLAETAGLPDAQRVGILVDLGTDQRMLRRLDDALATFERTDALARESDGEGSELELRVRAEQSTTLVYAGRFAEADAIARGVVDGVGRARAHDSEAYSDALNALAYVRLSWQHYEDAVELLRQVVALNRALHPRIHSAVSTSLNDLGYSLAGAGHLVEAEAALREAAQIHAELLGKAHPHYAGTLANLARVIDREGRFEEAHGMLDEAFATRRQALGDEAISLDGTWRALALNALHRGDAAAAQQAGRRALELDLGAYGPRHPVVALSQLVLGQALAETGDADEAERLLRDAAETGDAMFGTPNDTSGVARASLARLFARHGRADAAWPLFERALAELRGAVGENHCAYADALAWQGEAQLAAGDAAAAPTLRAAVAAARRAYPDGNPFGREREALLAQADARAR